ncbi:DegT/DnrJ/EryC1/StrS family aminotransferase [Candidatus Woesearchaeota archaeon]|nr:DegT/DnrJ/EryC1/StrS family aminotransferase [Candidatus Woesearchaeota archaeon]
MIPIAKPLIGSEEINAIADVIKSGMIAQGQRVEKFESLFAELCGTEFAVAVNSGTAALHAALKASGVKHGDEVITTPFTFIATANTILMQGAKPVFADIDEATFNISPEKIQQKVGKKTKAIVTVDLYGHLCDYDKIGEIAKDKSLIVIEDACQSVNAEYNGKKSGSFGDIAGFSFYATKNITCGEGGAITTNNREYAENARLFRQHGRASMRQYEHTELGYNYRMTDISAAMLLEQLKKLELITKRRIENAEYLSKGLSKIKGIKVPVVKKGYKHVFHQYTIKVEDSFKLNRDELAKHLNKKGIGCSVYYPKPLHLYNHFKRLGYKSGDFPVAEKLSRQVISLPVYPQLEKEQLNRIVDAFGELE